MNYRLNNKIVRIDLSDDGTLLILDEKGNKVLNKYIRCHVDAMHRDGIFISGFTIPFNKHSKFVDMFFSYGGVV